jgi:putative ABC transport system substrate-binding protein
MKVDLIVAFQTPSALAAREATAAIPIVMAPVGDPVGSGLVASLARPGGNVTGVESLAPELDAKRLELLKQIVPGLATVGVLYNPADQGTPIHLKSVQAASRILHVAVTPLEVRQLEDFDAVLSAPAGKPFDALLTFTDGWLTSGRHWKRVADFARAHRIPTVCEFRFYTELGCLIAYGPTFDEFSQRTARQIDLILKGAKPADLPFEQVTRFELVVNMKAARAIGVTIPQSVLLRADEVIE